MATISQRGTEFNARHEGVVLRAYRCPAGVLTIGIGHTNRAGGFVVKPGMRITKQQAYDIFQDDVRRNFGPRVVMAMPKARQHEFDGAVSFDYNTGAIHRASWVKAFKRHDRKEVRRRLSLWNKGGGRVLPGLVRRRREEGDLVLDGNYHDGKAIDLVDPTPEEKETADRVVAYPDSRDEWEFWQQALREIGYDPGPVDGIPSDKTRKAVRAFQKAHPDLDVDGIPGPATQAQILRVQKMKNRGAAAGLSADQLAGIDPVLAAGVVGILAAAGLTFHFWRHRGELAERFNKFRGV